MPTRRPAPDQDGEPALSSAQVVAVVSELLAGSSPVRLAVDGQSMAPFIRAGDLVTLTPDAQRSVALGDVVAFSRAHSRLVLHRVVELRGERLRTRGDALREADEAIQRREVLGRVTRLERGGTEVRFGLGRERRLIALVSRYGVLSLGVRITRRLRRLIGRRRARGGSG